MITMATKQEIKYTIDIVAKSCDICGTPGTEDNLFQDITTIKFEPGYGSKYDGETAYIDICDSCFDSHFRRYVSR